MSTNGSIKRVGILFSGGPAPAANAVISAAALSFINAGVEVVGFYDGYSRLEKYSADNPLNEGCDYDFLTRDDVSRIRSDKAILIRTARANPGKPISTIADLSDAEKNTKLRNVLDAFAALEIDALVSLGGDDTLKTANYLFRMQTLGLGTRPLSVVHLPKTIDNDYYGIDWTFGFTSAANLAAVEMRNLYADAQSGSVYYVLEIMGRNAGWLTYAAGIAGDAHKIISVEDVEGTFDLDVYADQVAELIEARLRDGRSFGIVCIAEGLVDKLPDHQRPQAVDEHGNTVLADAEIGKTFAKAIEERYKAKTGKSMKVRHKQLGYETRCVEPTAFDIMLGAQLGVGACRALVEDELTGVMVSLEGQFDIKYVPFDDLIDPTTLKTRIRLIERDSDFAKLARALEYREVQ
jgi:ATP-dependent phosphofructokinase / diphosphate-dependent phosphofructokinase